MMYYENKKDVKRQVYVDTLNAFNDILLTRRNIFKISHQWERMGGEINNISTSFFYSLIWTLVSSSFDSQKIFLKLLFCFVFNFPLKTDTVIGTWNGYPFNPSHFCQLNSIVYWTWKVGFLKGYNAPAVMDTTYSSLHLLILPIFPGCQQQALQWEKKASCCPREAPDPNSGACFTKHLASASPNSEPSLYGDNGMLDAEFPLQ